MLESVEDKLAFTIDALSAIADPIGYAEARAKRLGYTLTKGDYEFFKGTPERLSQIARCALRDVSAGG